MISQITDCIRLEAEAKRQELGARLQAQHAQACQGFRLNHLQIKELIIKNLSDKFPGREDLVRSLDEVFVLSQLGEFIRRGALVIEPKLIGHFMSLVQQLGKLK